MTALAAILAGCPGQEVGTLEQISVVKYRYVIDESADVARVVGLARNTGELPTPEGEVIATLRSRTGSFTGQNRVALPALEAGEERQFALAVNSHGSVETVEITIVEPGTVTEEGAEQQSEDDSEEDEDGDDA
jgi:hypothetical protein